MTFKEGQTSIKWREGQKVRMKEGCGGVKKGEICTLKWGNEFGGDKNKLYAHSKTSACYHQEFWEPLENTWDTIKAGDFVKDARGETRKVLGVLDEIVFVSKLGDDGLVDFGNTKAYFKRDYTIVQPESEMIEMTLEEVARLKGIPVERLRIKNV